MCEEGNVNGEMKINHVSKIKNEDRWFKKKKYLKREQMLSTDSRPMWKSFPFIINHSPPLYNIFMWMQNWICDFWFYLITQSSLTQMPRSAFLVQMDPFGSTFKDWRSLSHHKFKLLKLRFCGRFCGKFLSSVSIPSDPRTILSQELETSLIWKLNASSFRIGASAFHTAENCSVQLLLVAFCLFLDVSLGWGQGKPHIRNSESISSPCPSAHLCCWQLSPWSYILRSFIKGCNKNPALIIHQREPYEHPSHRKNFIQHLLICLFR